MADTHDSPALQHHEPGHAHEWEDVWKQQSHQHRYIHWGRMMYNMWFTRFMQRFLTRNTRMVELGCGTASLGMQLAEHIAHYTGIDSSSTAIAEAFERAQEKNRTNIGLLQADVFEDIAVPAYDIVWSQGLVEHFQDPARMIERHMDFCRPGGKVIISVPSKYSYHHAWYKLGNWPWTAQKFYTKQELKACVESIDHAKWKHVEVMALHPIAAGITLVVIQL